MLTYSEGEIVKQSVKKYITKSTPSDGNTLSIYLKEINKTSLLTREEEVDLAKRIVQGDEAAKERLVKSNLRFVVNVAKKYQNQGLPLADLISEGNIGLLNAVERFDVNRGLHFISYAVWWIRQAILRAICEKSRMIRLPLNRINELMQIEKVRKDIDNVKSETDEIRRIANFLSMDEGYVSDLMNISRDYISLDGPISKEKDSSVLSDFIEDKATQLPEESMVHSSLKTDINTILGTLEEKEAGVIKLRFGLNGHNPLSLKEIGDRYGLTKERIRQIEKKAIERLRHPTRTRQLFAYVN